MAKLNIPVQDGTSQSQFQIGALDGSNTVRVKVVSNAFEFRDGTDSIWVPTTASLVQVTGDDIVLGSGGAAELTIERNTGQSADMTVVFPDGPGSVGQVLGILSVVGDVVTLDWFSTGSTASSQTTYEVDVNFGDTSPIALGALPANFDVSETRVTIETPFDGTAPNLSVGISGNTSKYMTAGSSYLKADAKSVFTNTPGETPSGSTESVIVTYAASSSTVGKARVYVTGSIPL